MKENQIRELVNELRDIAIEYHGTQQLRERIARTVRAAIIQAGNSPVTQDGWISCSERMPDNDESKPIAIFTGKCLGQGMFVATYDDDGFFDYWEGMEIIGVSHWMQLPDPPFDSEAYTYLLHQQSIVNLQSMLRCHLTHALEVVTCLVQNAVLEILQKKKQCVDGLMIMCAAIADTTTLKTHLESVVKTSLSELIRNAKATKKANLFIHI